MRGGALPPALLCAALGFALAYAPVRGRVAGVVGLILAAVITTFLPIPAGWVEPVFAGCWISIALTSSSVHLPGGVGERTAALLGLNAGVWAGAVVAISGRPLDLAIALPAVLVMAPAAWLLATPARLGVKIVASWLIAVAALAGTLPFVPTPGYVQDHRE